MPVTVYALGTLRSVFSKHRGKYGTLSGQGDARIVFTEKVSIQIVLKNKKKVLVKFPYWFCQIIMLIFLKVFFFPTFSKPIPVFVL